MMVFRGREIALQAVRITAGFDFPDYEQDYELVALDHPGEYPIDRGRIVSNRDLDIAVSEYDEHFEEEHVEWSNALHSRLVERGSYLCGPLARYALAADRLSPLAQEVASRGITVNAVAPGFVTTAMTDRMTEQQRAKLTESIPLGRIGRPEDVAAAVAYLASDEAGWVTGATLHVNGGMAMI